MRQDMREPTLPEAFDSYDTLERITVEEYLKGVYAKAKRPLQLYTDDGRKISSILQPIGYHKDKRFIKLENGEEFEVSQKFPVVVVWTGDPE